jgi:hypothetical protein
VINTRLYEQLKRAFGSVRVANEGVPFAGHVQRSAIATPGRKYHVRTDVKGECYCVCCPFCGDRRYRLWFAHRWGTKFKGYDIKGAAICFNEECHRRPDFYKKVCGMLDGYISAPKPLEEVRARELAAMALPGTCVPLDALPDGHYARRYVESRGYSVREMSEYWGIVFREEGSALADHYRLVIPVYGGSPSARILLGWQARYLEPNGNSTPPDKYTPRYMSSPGMRKSRLLFNGWRMPDKLVIVCEGPFDAMRVGPCGVAILGSDISIQQESMLLANWEAHGAPVAVMLDNDMDEKAERVAARLRQRGCMAVRVRAPGGKDPGDCGRRELLESVAAAFVAVREKT